MTTHRIGQLGIALSVTLTLCCAWIAPVDGQTSPGGFPNVVGERTTHGVLYDFISALEKDPGRLTIRRDPAFR